MAPSSYSRGATVLDAHGVLEIRIPAPRYASAIFALPICLAAWAFGMALAIQALLSDTDNSSRVPLFAWLTAWSIGGAWAVVTSLWLLWGRQIVRLTHHALSIRWEVIGVGYTADYETRHISGLRAIPASSPIWGWGGGPFVFDYGARTVRFGLSLDEAEAKSLLPQFARVLPASRTETHQV